MAQAKHWYTDCFRRNLVDMHIEDWNPVFLSQFSAQEYYANLQRAHIQAPMIYLQSHVGHCYFPTKVGHMHGALRGREDMMRDLLTLCRRGGMHPIGYYSLIFNTYEEDRHPEWRVVTGEDGSSARQRGERYGHCCPNNPEYRAFTLRQIEEMAEYFRDENGELLLDGMFYDMLFWPGICRCESCRKRYAEETGRKPEDMPAELSWDDPAALEFARARERWMGEFSMWVTENTKRLMPSVSVEHNYAQAVAGDTESGSTELVNDACDYAGGDLYGDLYNHSFTAKYYYGVTRHQPFEYMTCRCDRTLGAHTVTKSEDSLAVEVLLTAAHHGASLIIDAIDPRGTMDERVYERIGRVFERQMPYEPYFRGEMIADVGVYFPTTGRHNPSGQNFTAKTCAVNLTRTLIEANVPVGVLSNRSTEQLKNYRMIFAPDATCMPDEMRRAIIEYVRDGGTLYFSSSEEPALLREFFGAEITCPTEDKATYIAPTKAAGTLLGEFTAAFPMPIEYRLPLVAITDPKADTAVWATLTLPYTHPGEQRFASIHSNPPGIATDTPVLLYRKYGCGQVVWSAAPFEQENRRAHRELMIRIIDRLIGRNSLSVSSDAPRQVEIVTFRNGTETLLSTVDLLCSDERLTIGDFSVAVKCENPPARVFRLASRTRGEEAVPFIWEKGYVRFTVRKLVMFDMFHVLHENSET